jgi:predicted DNA-binding transcriptional regulator YafY
MSKSDRLLHILNLLRSRRNLNAARLARECGVTERSIYRDIIALSEANIPVYYDKGYKLASDNFLPPLNFTLDEYTALKLALDSSPLKRSARYRNLLRRVKSKVEAGLSQLVRHQKTTFVESIHIDIPTTVNHRIVREYFADLEEAISENLQVEIEYEAVQSGITTRIVEPYFIMFRARAFYFVAYCLLREDFRTFRLDRLRRLAVTDTRFRRHPGITPDDYFEGSWEVFSGEATEVVIRFAGTAARVVLLDRHHEGESVTAFENGECEYRATVLGTAEIKRWVLGFGDEAEVIQPQELRREMAAISDHFAETYRKH